MASRTQFDGIDVDVVEEKDAGSASKGGKGRGRARRLVKLDGANFCTKGPGRALYTHFLFRDRAAFLEWFQEKLIATVRAAVGAAPGDADAGDKIGRIPSGVGAVDDGERIRGLDQVRWSFPGMRLSLDDDSDEVDPRTVLRALLLLLQSAVQDIETKPGASS